jgi:hypothetical protein
MEVDGVLIPGIEDSLVGAEREEHAGHVAQEQQHGNADAERMNVELGFDVVGAD